jgi:hypothetical protein
MGRGAGNAEWAKLKALDDEVGERQVEIVITKSMAKAIFVRALNDLNYDGGLKYLDDRPLGTAEEGRDLQAEAQDWFLSPDDGVCSLNAVCQLLNYDPDLITYAVRKHFASPADVRKKILPPGGRRLDDADVRSIKAALARGERPSKVAEEHRVTRPYVTKIRKGRRRAKDAA